MNTIKLWAIWSAFCFMLASTGCKKFVTISAPQTELVSSTVFDNDATASSAVTGVYSNMMSSYGFASGGNYSISLLAGLYADEFENFAFSTDYDGFYNDQLTPVNSTLTYYLWNEPYQYIYTSNSIIEGLAASQGISTGLKAQLTGESLFIRAFCHFYLVNLFGPVPYIDTTNYLVNKSAARVPEAIVYQNIIADLKNAGVLLSGSYNFSNGERVRPTKWAADALLARAYLYTGNWAGAEAMSDSVINNTSLFELAPLDSVFLANSSEAIWQLEPVIPGLNTLEGYTFILSGVPSTVALTSQLMESFEPGDNRQAEWTDSIIAGGQTYYYPYKYKIQSSATVSEYSMVLRLAEQYLVRAEARAMQNNFTGALSDLNTLRQRAGLSPRLYIDQGTLLKDIMHERQVELFTEWGHRLLDLKRYQQALAVLGPIKPGWKATDTLYPIPSIQIQNDPNITQNPGY